MFGIGSCRGVKVAVCVCVGLSMARLEDKPFNEFVRVHARGQARNISSAREAAEWLLFRWPQEINTARAREARKSLP